MTDSNVNKNTPISFLIISLVTAVIGVGLGIFLTFAAGLDLEGGSIAVLGFAPLYLWLDRTKMPGLLIGPSLFIYVYHALGYAIGPLGQRYLVGSESFIEEGMVLAQWGAVIGLTAYVIVYHALFDLITRSLTRTKHAIAVKNVELGQHWEGFTILLLIISVIVLAYGTASGVLRRIGGFQTDANSVANDTFVNAFADVHRIVFFFLGFLAIKKGGRWRWAWLGSYLTYTAFYTLQGSRGPAVTALILSAIGAVLAGLPTKRVLAMLMVAILAFVPLAGIVALYRSHDQYVSRYDEGVVAQISAFLEASQDFTDSSNVDGDQHGAEAFLVAVTALTVDRVMIYTPIAIPFAGLENVDAALFSLVPRIIYPDRPEVGDSNTIAVLYGQGSADRSTVAYIPTVGEGYRRLGWIGIPIMYSLVGLVYASICAIAWSKREKLAWLAVLIFIIVEAPSAWSATFNTTVWFAIFNIPKYLIFFIILSRIQNEVEAFLIRRGLVRQEPEPNSLQLQGNE